jgi:hypothetical protein
LAWRNRPSAQAPAGARRTVDADEEFYSEAQEELDRKPYPTLEGFKIVLKYVAEQNPKLPSSKPKRSSKAAG